MTEEYRSVLSLVVSGFKQSAREAKDAVRDVREAVDEVNQAGAFSETAQEARNAANAAREVGEEARRAGQEAQEAANEAKQAVTDAAQQAERDAREAANTAKDAAAEAAQATGQIGQEVERVEDQTRGGLFSNLVQRTISVFSTAFEFISGFAHGVVEEYQAIREESAKAGESAVRSAEESAARIQTGPKDPEKVDVKDVSVYAKSAAVSVAKKTVSGIKAMSDKLTVKNKTVNVTAHVTKWTGRKIGDTRPRAKGGVFQNGRWSDIPQYAGGTLNAGTVFAAGERGPEVVGHIGGRTEVLNKSQIASAIYSAMVSAVAQYKSFFGSVASSIAQIPKVVSRYPARQQSVPAMAMGGTVSAQYSPGGSFAESLARQLSAQIGSTGSNQPIRVQVVLDGRVVAESTVRHLKQQSVQGWHPLSSIV